MGFLDKIFGTYSDREIKRVKPLVDKVLSYDEEFSKKTDEELQAMTPAFKERLEKGETLDDILPEAFALCREAAWRVLGMKPFPVQVLGGIILHQGRISEMKTGEGKTLVAVMPTYLNALTGKGAHVVTVNDYLAKTNSEQMGKIYNWLGLTVGVNLNGMSNMEKQEAYRCDITYGTNNEFGFDYLRDNMATSKEELIQRELNYAIVDEVDSILIDEARTPLIISGRGDKPNEMYKVADNFVKTLTALRVKEFDSKEEDDDIEADYIVDEKAKTATLTPHGTAKAEKYFNKENWNDPENLDLAHYVNQAVKAHGVMTKDIDYIVKDGEILIVDEFTGRIMVGRRFSEGLHQAIEAKEHVQVQRESKTFATITFQNFFRMYTKLSGMTGTAMTEEDEFREIYGLDVVAIPTNRPVIRKDHKDIVYKTEAGKYKQVVEKIKECYEKGQPVLIGTVSVDKSERLSKMLKANGIPHNVLNAKHHQQEAEIVAQAGKYKAVTISTNMAGRGTDIMLGGNPDFMAKDRMRRMGYQEENILAATSFYATDDEEILAEREIYAHLVNKFKEQIAPEAEKVREAGGLFVLGTERHESRRIDNQLRGRSGRQGDPGESCFVVSLEDDLMRLFGGQKVQNIMDSMGLPEDEPLSNNMLSNVIETSQKKIEGRNFQIRKNVLQYDDVMNKQREIIYGQRNKVLNGEDIHENIENMFKDYFTEMVARFIPDDDVRDNWNIAGLHDYFSWLLKEDEINYTVKELLDQNITREDITKVLLDKANAIMKEKEERVTPAIMRDMERFILMSNVDKLWVAHIDNMDQLKRGIGLRAIGQHDPVVEYRMEGFDMFDEMIEEIKEETVKMLILIQPHILKREPKEPPKNLQMSGGGEEQITKQPIRKEKVGRNDPCPCGSGKKYKNCCGK